MEIPKQYTIQADNTWELIETVYDRDAFIFWPDADIEFAVDETPAADEIIPILSLEKNKFKKPTSFYVRGLAGTIIYLAPFDGVVGGGGGAAAPVGEFQGDRDASLGTLPVTRTNGDPIVAGDSRMISVGGTVAGLFPHETLTPGDSIKARVNAAAVVGDWFSLQGNNPTQGEVINLRFATIAALEACTPNALDKAFVGENKAEYYYDDNAGYRDVDGINVLSTSLGGNTRWIRFAKNTRVIKINLNADEETVVNHNLGGANLHIDVYLNSEKIGGNIVGEVDATSMQLLTAVSGLYTIVLTRVETDYIANTNYKNRAATGLGLVETNLDTMQTERTLLPGVELAASALVGEDLFVLTYSSRELHRLDVNTGLAKEAAISTGDRYHTINTDGEYLYLGGYVNQQARVNLSGPTMVIDSTLSMIADAPWDVYPFDMECKDGIGYLLAGDHMREVDLATHSFIAGREISGLAYDSPTASSYYPIGACISEGYLYITRFFSGESGANHYCEIQMYDRATLTLQNSTEISHVRGTGNNGGGAGKPFLRDELIYVPLYFGEAIQVIDRRTLALVDTIDTVADYPGIRWISILGSKLYGNTYGSGILYEFDLNDLAATPRSNSLGSYTESNVSF